MTGPAPAQLLAQGRVRTVEELRSHYLEPRSVVERKVLPRLDGHCRRMIEQSSLVFVSTADAAGRCDVSPRGDAPGFVRALDDTTLVIPDRPGNNRLDTLINLLTNPHIGLLFVVPGHDDTLRVNGRAEIRHDPDLLRDFTVRGRSPVTVLLIRLDEAYMHCGRAFKRGSVWEARGGRPSLPSMGEVLADQTDASAQERALLVGDDVAELY